jgi:SAM-dependent methyltransferase
MNYPLSTEGFDCIASIATLHHLPLAAVLAKLKAALKPGGVLLVLDLYQGEGLGDLLSNVVTIPYHLLLMQTRPGNHKQSPESAAAWEAHGRDDQYVTMNEARRVCADLLPGAKVTRHWLWRYSIVWTKGI